MTVMGASPTAVKVCKNLPKYYLLNADDVFWLNHIDLFVEGKPTNVAIVTAMRKALPKNKKEYMEKAEKYPSMCDPWELLVDAGICDTKCNPI